MKKPKTYPTVNAMLRGTMSRQKAEEMIDNMTNLQTHQNLNLLSALMKLVNSCTSRNTSGVSCPDRRILANARRIAKLHGAVFGE